MQRGSEAFGAPRVVDERRFDPFGRRHGQDRFDAAGGGAGEDAARGREVAGDGVGEEGFHRVEG